MIPVSKNLSPTQAPTEVHGDRIKLDGRIFTAVRPEVGQEPSAELARQQCCLSSIWNQISACFAAICRYLAGGPTVVADVTEEKEVVPKVASAKNAIEGMREYISDPADIWIGCKSLITIKAGNDLISSTQVPFSRDILDTIKQDEIQKKVPADETLFCKVILGMKVEGKIGLMILDSWAISKGTYGGGTAKRKELTLPQFKEWLEERFSGESNLKFRTEAYEYFTA